MTSDTKGSNNELELKRIDLEHYKIRLNFRKYVLGSVFVAIAIALIPPSFQLATAHLEYVKTEAERLTKMEEFHEAYVRDFLSTALNQDVELRIRFAEYFSFVSSGQFQRDWGNYRDELKSLRENKRREIDTLEDTLQQASTSSSSNPNDEDRLQRHLAWAYKEVGYVAKNRAVASNPRLRVLGVEVDLDAPGIDRALSRVDAERTLYDVGKIPDAEKSRVLALIHGLDAKEFIRLMYVGQLKNLCEFENPSTEMRNYVALDHGLRDKGLTKIAVNPATLESVRAVLAHIVQQGKSLDNGYPRTCYDMTLTNDGYNVKLVLVNNLSVAFDAERKASP